MAIARTYAKSESLSQPGPLSEQAAYDLGFESVAAGPLVRSSYHADQNLPESHRAETLIA